MSALSDYQRFLTGLRLRHFSAHEITDYAKQIRGGIRNTLPPRALWPNIVAPLWILDHLRAHLGKSITLTSIYRSPDYNAAVGGARFSQHKLNQAIDFQVSGISPRVARNRLLTLRQAGMFRGGLGLYSTFTHVDTRGHNATWG